LSAASGRANDSPTTLNDSATTPQRLLLKSTPAVHAFARRPAARISPDDGGGTSLGLRRRFPPCAACFFLSFFFFARTSRRARRQTQVRRQGHGQGHGRPRVLLPPRPRRVPGRRLLGAAATGGGRRRASLTAPGGPSVGVVTAGDGGGGGVRPFVPRRHASRVCPAPRSPSPAAGRCRALGPPRRGVVVAAIGGGAFGRGHRRCLHPRRCRTVVR